MVRGYVRAGLFLVIRALICERFNQRSTKFLPHTSEVGKFGVNEVREKLRILDTVPTEGVGNLSYLPTLLGIDKETRLVRHFLSLSARSLRRLGRRRSGECLRLTECRVGLRPVHQPAALSWPRVMFARADAAL